MQAGSKELLIAVSASTIADRVEVEDAIRRISLSGVRPKSENSVKARRDI